MKNKKIKNMSEADRYKQAYDMLMEYWDSIDKEEQKKLDIRLKRIGL